MNPIEPRVFLKSSIAGAACLLNSSLPASAAEQPATSSLPALPLAPDYSYTKAFFEKIKRKHLEDAVRLAADWLADTAMIQTETLPPDTYNDKEYPYTNFKGCVRDTFSPFRSRNPKLPAPSWQLFGSVWHTGQAAKALTLAAKYFKNDHYLDQAKLAIGFIRDKQVTDKKDPNFGCIWAFEDTSEALNTSAILEACDGLYHLSEHTGDLRYRQWAIDAVTWVVKTLYMNNGLFCDGFHYRTRERYVLEKLTKDSKDGVVGRPLIDDGILYKTWLYTQNDLFKNTFLQIADKLLETEAPAGNWMAFQPCKWKLRSIHVRQAFWWGRPLRMAYALTGQQKYLDAFNRAVDWYIKTFNRDGGITNPSFDDSHPKPTFNTATSGTSAAALMLRDQCAELGNTKNLDWLITCMNYILSLQITKTAVPALKGAIIESIMPPDGSDTCPYWVRDVATTFFITAASFILLDYRNLNGKTGNPAS